MTGIVITSYERFLYLQQCLYSVAQSNFDAETQIIIIDDNSMDERIREWLECYTIPSVQIEVVYNKRRKGNAANIITAFDRFCNRGCDTLINLDNDAIVKPSWLTVLLQLRNKFPEHIISGFDAYRHKSIKEGKGYCYKRTIGGINLALSPDRYKTFLKPILSNSRIWDWRMSRASNQPFIVTRPSQIQHIGKVSTLGHIGADFSKTF